MVTLEVDLPVLNAVNNTGAPGPSQWHIETTPEALALFTTFEAGLRGLAALKGIEVPANHFSSNLLENNIAVDNTTLFVVSGGHPLPTPGSTITVMVTLWQRVTPAEAGLAEDVQFGLNLTFVPTN